MTFTNQFADRLNRLQTAMTQQSIDLVAIAPTANMRYLLGFAPHADERLSLLLVGRNTIELIIPSVNADQVESHTGRQVRRWADADGPERALTEGLKALGLTESLALAVDDSMRADILLTLQRVLRPASSTPAGDVLAQLRMLKSAEELERLAAAAVLADQGILAGAAACRPGVTERDVAAAIERSFRENGAEQVDFLIVASGPNSAFPHHETSGRILEAGDVVLMDIGATRRGYKSDITRVVSLGQPSAELRQVYEAVRQGNEQGRAAVKPGVLARDVDKATRTAIEQLGYGDYFIHRTGHGLGLDVHEPPSVSSTDETILQPSMVFSVEPGVYLPGKFGIRIEDIVVVTETGSRRLTGLDHELIVQG